MRLKILMLPSSAPTSSQLQLQLELRWLYSQLPQPPTHPPLLQLLTLTTTSTLTSNLTELGTAQPQLVFFFLQILVYIIPRVRGRGQENVGPLPFFVKSFLDSFPKSILIHKLIIQISELSYSWVKHPPLYDFCLIQP